MRIAFYAPFKPLHHPRPSGDQVIGQTLFTWLQAMGHDVLEISRLRTRWIFHNPLRMGMAFAERWRIQRVLRQQPVDCWFTHHCYYKAPDILGPAICRQQGLPYVLFQPSFATKYRKMFRTALGFYLNQRALQTADRALTNRCQDLQDLARCIAAEKIFFIQPGIHPQQYLRDERARLALRRQWRAGDRPVILSAAMFRDDVKSVGVARVLESCRRLSDQGEDFLLVLAGDGCARPRLEALAKKLPEGKVRFVGQLRIEEMQRFYSAGDFFVFPGINESLGMVYLEAQASGLPVVAYDNGGIDAVVAAGTTGFLTPLDDDAAFDAAVQRLLRDVSLRDRMGEAAMSYVQQQHDVNINYQLVERILQELIEERA